MLDNVNVNTLVKMLTIYIIRRHKHRLDSKLLFNIFFPNIVDFLDGECISHIHMYTYVVFVGTYSSWHRHSPSRKSILICDLICGHLNDTVRNSPIPNTSAFDFSYLISTYTLVIQIVNSLHFVA